MNSRLSSLVEDRALDVRAQKRHMIRQRRMWGGELRQGEK